MTFFALVSFFERIEATRKRLEMAAILADLFRGLHDPEESAVLAYLCQGQLRPAFENIEFGISEKLLNKAVALAAGKTPEEINAAFQKSGDYGLVAESLAKGHRRSLPMQTVYQRLGDIARISGTGSVAKKIEVLAGLLKELAPAEAKYVVRIIQGRLRLGVGDATVLDGLARAYARGREDRVYLENAYNRCSDLGLVARAVAGQGIEQLREFPVVVGCPVRPALAARLSSPQEIIQKIGACAVEEKYDGFRAQVHKQGRTVTVFSRNLENISAMFPEIIEGTLRQVRAKQAIFEGEAMAFNPATGNYLPFQVTVQRKRKHNIAAMQEEIPLRLIVFDILFAESDLTGSPLADRRRRMEEDIEQLPGGILQISPVQAVANEKELNDIFEDAVAHGCEGIIAKRWDAPYQAGGRNFNWIKLKRSYASRVSDSIDAVIVGYYHGKGARASLGIGSLLVAVYDPHEERFKTIAKVGSGWSEEELTELKTLLGHIRQPGASAEVDSLLEPDVWVSPRYVIEIQADEITKSPVHTCGKMSPQDPGFALRFPRAVRSLRRDKDARDATTVQEIRDLYALQGRRG